MVRKPIDEEKYEIAQMNGDNHQPRVRVPAAIFAVPWAALSGVFEAPWYGIGNSVINFNKPFSKEQFSIVESGNQPNQEDIYEHSHTR